MEKKLAYIKQINSILKTDTKIRNEYISNTYRLMMFILLYSFNAFTSVGI